SAADGRAHGYRAKSCAREFNISICRWRKAVIPLNHSRTTIMKDALNLVNKSSQKEQNLLVILL
ncbi:hypothetical protein ACQP3F_32525, partial [Escherichia coli]